MSFYSKPKKSHNNKKGNFARKAISTAILVGIVGSMGAGVANAEPTSEEWLYIEKTYPTNMGTTAFQTGKYHYGITELNFDPVMLAQYEAMGVVIDVPATIAATNEAIKNAPNFSYANLQLVVTIDETAFQSHPASQKIDLNDPDFPGNYGLSFNYGFNNVTTDALQDKTAFPVDKAITAGTSIDPIIFGTRDIKEADGFNYNPETGAFDTPITLSPLSSFYNGGVANDDQEVGKRSYILDIINPAGANRAADATIGYNGVTIRGMNPDTTANCLVSVCGGQFQLMAQGNAGEDGWSQVALLEPLTFTVKFEDNTGFPQTFKDNPWVGVNGDKVWLEPVTYDIKDGSFRDLNTGITARDTANDVPVGFANVITSITASETPDGGFRFYATVDNSKYSHNAIVTATQIDPTTAEIVITNGNDNPNSPWISEDGDVLQVGDAVSNRGETYTVTAVTSGSIAFTMVSDAEFTDFTSEVANTHGRVGYNYTGNPEGVSLGTTVGSASVTNTIDNVGDYEVKYEFTQPAVEDEPIARPDVKSGKYGEPVSQAILENDEASDGWELITSSIVLTDPADETRKKTVTYDGIGVYSVEDANVVFNGAENFEGDAPATVYTWTESRVNDMGETETREVSSTVQAIIEPRPVEEIPEETPEEEIPVEEIPEEEIPVEEIPEVTEEVTVTEDTVVTPAVLKDGGESNVLPLTFGGLLTMLGLGAAHLVRKAKLN